MRVPQPDIIEHFGNADAVPQLPERCLSRKAGIVRCCLFFSCVSPNADGFSGVLFRRFLEFANHFLFSQFSRHVP
jgi:hypothetical protein